MSEETKPVAPVAAKPVVSSAPAVEAERRDPWTWAKAKNVARRKAGGAFARAKFGAGHEVTEAEFDAAIEADAAEFRIG